MKVTRNNIKERRGFALIEILIAVTILSIVLMTVISGVSRSIYIMSGNRSSTKAMLIARSSMNMFILHNMRGTDIRDEPVKDYSGFYVTRESKRFENALLGPLPAYQTDITVSWKEQGIVKKYKISYIYQGK